MQSKVITYRMAEMPYTFKCEIVLAVFVCLFEFSVFYAAVSNPESNYKRDLHISLYVLVLHISSSCNELRLCCWSLEGKNRIQV